MRCWPGRALNCLALLGNGLNQLAICSPLRLCMQFSAIRLSTALTIRSCVQVCANAGSLGQGSDERARHLPSMVAAQRRAEKNHPDFGNSDSIRSR